MQKIMHIYKKGNKYKKRIFVAFTKSEILQTVLIGLAVGYVVIRAIV